MRLEDRVAIVVGAGQSPGEGVGNGRATAITFAREGAKVLCVDRNFASAHETVAMIEEAGGVAAAFEADVTRDEALAAMVEDARTRWGRIDVLHNNVGVSIAGGDAELLDLTRPPSIGASRSTSRARSSRANTSFQSCGHNAAARSSTFRRWPRSRAIRTSRTRRRRRR